MEEKHLPQEILVRFFEGTASQEEIQDLEQWMAAAPENRQHVLDLKNLWDASIPMQLDEKEAWKRVQTRLVKKSVTARILPVFRKVAAVLLIPLMLAFIWLWLAKNRDHSQNNVQYTSVTAAFGSISVFNLPDGSRVWLNAGSTLQYPSSFRTRSRNVSLAGEGYFEVHSDPSSPFTVETAHLRVKATGTRFNVSSSSLGARPAVTLLEGKLEITTSSHEKVGEKIWHLKPNQLLVYDTIAESGQISEADTAKNVAWKDGKLVFRNDALTEVARQISLQYDVDIVIADDSLKNLHFRATFQHESLSELLRLLSLSYPIRFREEAPVKNPDGTFKRRKIVITAAKETK